MHLNHFALQAFDHLYALIEFLCVSLLFANSIHIRIVLVPKPEQNQFDTENKISFFGFFFVWRSEWQCGITPIHIEM